ncbi:hypothetical protein ACA910_018801 [Epithemia clementina (nom. ined.)]
MAGVLFTLTVGLIVVVYVLWSLTAGDDNYLRAGGGLGSPWRDDHPPAEYNSERYHALAQDIIELLDCPKLFLLNKSTTLTIIGCICKVTNTKYQILNTKIW